MSKLLPLVYDHTSATHPATSRAFDRFGQVRYLGYGFRETICVVERSIRSIQQEADK